MNCRSHGVMEEKRETAGGRSRLLQYSSSSDTPGRALKKELNHR